MDYPRKGWGTINMGTDSCRSKDMDQKIITIEKRVIHWNRKPRECQCEHNFVITGLELAIYKITGDSGRVP